MALTLASSNALTWSSPDLQGFVLSAGNLTGINSAGGSLFYDDLIPLTSPGLTIVTGAPGAAPTGNAVVIDGNGIATNALSIFDTGTNALVPVTVVNGALLINGSPVGGAGGAGSENTLIPLSSGGNLTNFSGSPEGWGELVGSPRVTISVSGLYTIKLNYTRSASGTNTHYIGSRIRNIEVNPSDILVEILPSQGSNVSNIPFQHNDVAYLAAGAVLSAEFSRSISSSSSVSNNSISLEVRRLAAY